MDHEPGARRPFDDLPCDDPLPLTVGTTTLAEAQMLCTDLAGHRIPFHTDLRFDESDRWVEIELPEQHAGILTSPAYLLRFQTNRARASRFADAFLCEPFTPPAGGLPASTEADFARFVSPSHVLQAA